MWCHKLLRFSACSIRYWEMGIGCVLTAKKNGDEPEGTTDEQKNNDTHINQLYDSQNKAGRHLERRQLSSC